MADAVDAYHKAIQLKPDCAEAHCNLGLVLQNQGEFAEALKAMRRGSRTGFQEPTLAAIPPLSGSKPVSKLVQLDAKLPGFLSGMKRPTDASECLFLAILCQENKHLYAASTRFYGEAFASDSRLTELPPYIHRYNGACAAALAGCGSGQDASALGEGERGRLRQQALAWLRDDLKLWRGLLEKEPGRTGPVLAAQMRHWLEDPDFAGVRGADAPASCLPEMERTDWQRLWEEVEALRLMVDKRPPTVHELKPQKIP